MEKRAYTEPELEALYERHVDMLWRICFTFLKNKADTEDAVQSTFIQLLSFNKRLENEAHEKAWLIVTAKNICKNYLRHWWQKNRKELPAEGMGEMQVREADELLEQVLELPEKYKMAIYLYYYEGYSSAEIAKILRQKEATVRSHLSRGRAQLRAYLEEEKPS